MTTTPATATPASTAPGAAATLAVRGLGRAYDDHYALVGLDAEFPAGTVTALLGPNGAGKSTLIGILSSRQSPSEGQVLFEGRRAHGGPAMRRRIGYVGHRTMVYGELTARENLRFFAQLFGIGDADARIDALLDRVGLARDKDRPVEGFSRGMAQRLTLARALLPEPSVLLLDEPLTGLDQAGVALALELFGSARDRGAALIMASHDLAATEKVADRALILANGRKCYEGPVQGDLAGLYAQAIAGELPAPVKGAA
ncbi:MAG: ABC transporter ATP-binding protein [Myxococcales bacterium]|nr:ABC transporter ATP-binding protein [Myxococcales bacterium]MCB9522116.1 ABC transporter ATP-binding protein [Myxococcales bacterium]